MTIKITTLTTEQRAVMAGANLPAGELVGAAAAQVAALPSRYYGQVATAARICNGLNTSNLQAMYTSRHIKRGTENTLQLVYWNGYISVGAGDSASEVARGSSAIYKVSLEYPIGSQPRLFTWGGALQGNLASGAVGLTDIMPFDVPDGAAFYLHCYQVAAAGAISANFPTVNLSGGVEGFNTGAATPDYTETIGGNPAKTTTGFSSPPQAILGWTRRPTVILFGDSRTAGIGDTGDYSTNTGILARTLGKSIGYINFGVPSQPMRQLRQSSVLRRTFLQYVTGVVIAQGENDQRINNSPAADIITNMQIFVNSINTEHPGKQIMMCTYEPLSLSSTDNYATTANQTPYTNEATRIGVNETLRARGIYGTSGLFDIASVLESDLNSTYWKPGLSANGTNYPITTDGLHSTQRGTQLVEKSGVVNANVFNRS